MGTIFKNVLLEDDTGGGCAAVTDIAGERMASRQVFFENIEFAPTGFI